MSHLQNDRPAQKRGLPVLLGPLPVDRSRQMGLGRLRDQFANPRSGAARRTRRPAGPRAIQLQGRGVVAGPNSDKKTRWAWVIATFFGAGLMKPGPGTYGSVAALLLWVGAAHLFPMGLASLAAATAVAALAATLIGIPAATIAARESGRKDPGFVVIDEVAGQWIALIAVRPDWRHAALALLLFRTFDIWKPWPIRRLEQLPEGTGIMLDDVAAGLLALLVGLIVARWF
jgi:phosphatidylglycerophosphatase A